MIVDWIIVIVAVLAALVTILSTATAVAAKAVSAKRARLQLEYDAEQTAIGSRFDSEHAALLEGDLLLGLYGIFPPAPEFAPAVTRPKPPPPPAPPVVPTYPPVLTCGRHGLGHVGDTRCPRCLDEEVRAQRLERRAPLRYVGQRPPCTCGIGRACGSCAPVEVGNAEYWMEKNRQACPCLSCGKAVPASGSRLCQACDVPAHAFDVMPGQVLAAYSVPPHAMGRPGQVVESMEGQRYEIVEWGGRLVRSDINVPLVWDDKAGAKIPMFPHLTGRGR